MPYIHFTEEQKLRANSVNLVEFLRRQGAKLIPSGRDKRLSSDHSITVRGNEWYDHESKAGGHAISFVQTYYGLTYPEAVKRLLDGEGVAYPQTVPSEPEKPKEFVLPPASPTMRRLYAYLLQQRFIDRDVLDAFTKRGMIYESCEKSRDGTKEYHNAVCVGSDEYGAARHAHVRDQGDGERDPDRTRAEEHERGHERPPFGLQYRGYRLYQAQVKHARSGKPQHVRRSGYRRARCGRVYNGKYLRREHIHQRPARAAREDGGRQSVPRRPLAFGVVLRGAEQRQERRSSRHREYGRQARYRAHGSRSDAVQRGSLRRLEPAADEDIDYEKAVRQLQERHDGGGKRAREPVRTHRAQHGAARRPALVPADGKNRARRERRRRGKLTRRHSEHSSRDRFFHSRRHESVRESQPDEQFDRLLDQPARRRREHIAPALPPSVQRRRDTRGSDRGSKHKIRRGGVRIALRPSEHTARKSEKQTARAAGYGSQRAPRFERRPAVAALPPRRTAHRLSYPAARHRYHYGVHRENQLIKSRPLRAEHPHERQFMQRAYELCRHPRDSQKHSRTQKLLHAYSMRNSPRFS